MLTRTRTLSRRANCSGFRMSVNDGVSCSDAVLAAWRAARRRGSLCFGDHFPHDDGAVSQPWTRVLSQVPPRLLLEHEAEHALGLGERWEDKGGFDEVDQFEAMRLVPEKRLVVVGL